MPRERRRVHYSGRVQGVGFRFTTQHLARDFEVVGHVRNLGDGTVELVVEGETAVVESFLAAIATEFGDKIHDVQSASELPGEPPLDGFSIRY